MSPWLREPTALVGHWGILHGKGTCVINRYIKSGIFKRKQTGSFSDRDGFDKSTHQLDFYTTGLHYTLHQLVKLDYNDQKRLSGCDRSEESSYI